MNYKNIFSLLIALSTFSCTSMVGMDVWDAAQDGNLERVKQLVSQGTQVDMQDKSGNTPLLCAACRDRLAVVQHLISKGANVSLPNNDGETPLHMAIFIGSFEIAKYLITNGAQIDAQNRYGSTPLHEAAAAGKLDIVEYLVSQGAQVDKQDKKGWTILFRAIWSGRLKAVKALCGLFNFRTSNEGNNWQQAQSLLRFLSIKNKEGETALDCAKEWNFDYSKKIKWKEIFDYLTKIQKSAKAITLPVKPSLTEGKNVDTTFDYKADWN